MPSMRKRLHVDFCYERRKVQKKTAASLKHAFLFAVRVLRVSTIFDYAASESCIFFSFQLECLRTEYFLRSCISDESHENTRSLYTDQYTCNSQDLRYDTPYCTRISRLYYRTYSTKVNCSTTFTCETHSTLRIENLTRLPGILRQIFLSVMHLFYAIEYSDGAVAPFHV